MKIVPRTVLVALFFAPLAAPELGTAQPDRDARRPTFLPGAAALHTPDRSTTEPDRRERTARAQDRVVVVPASDGEPVIGVRCPDFPAPVADLFFQSTGQDIHQLHASAQVGERAIVEGEDLPFVWGRSPDWQANEIRWDQARRERMIAQGIDQEVAQRETMFPHQGFEFQIRQRKFGGSEWRFRVKVAGHPNYDAPIVFPRDTRAGLTEGWLRLVLRPVR